MASMISVRTSLITSRSSGGCEMEFGGGLDGDFHIVEMVLFAADDLVVLVALAGDEDHIAFVGGGERSADGEAAIGLYGDVAAVFGVEADENLVNDRAGVLGARVVA